MPGALRLLHITDPHLHAARDARMRGVCTDATLVRVLERVRAETPGPDLVLATGDLVQDETRQGYARFRELLGGFGVPVYCLPGNHDAPALMREELSAPPFQFCGLGAHSPWLLLMLNSFSAGDDGGRLAPRELEFLERSLGAAAGQHVLLALHHQPIPMGSHWLDGVGLRDAEEFLAIVDRHPGVRGIVWGHVHQASDRLWRGVRMLSTPSTCSQFRPGSDTFALDELPPAFRWIELQADGTIRTTVVWVE